MTIPKYPDGNTYLLYKVTSTRGIEAFEVIARRYGKLYLKSGEIRSASAFVLKETAQRMWEKKQSAILKRKEIDERDSRIWDKWIKSKDKNKTALARELGLTIGVVDNAITKMSYKRAK